MYLQRYCSHFIHLLNNHAGINLFGAYQVLKTRLQLQGRYNNPYFKSGYNYRGTIDATRTVRFAALNLSL